jgi:restriction system protein
MLSHPVLLGLIVALVVGLALSFALGTWRSGRRDAAAGMNALCGLKWREFAHLVEDVLQERGFTRVQEERSPGDSSADLLMARGSARYLVQCKNGAAHSVTEQAVRDLAAQIGLQGAEGAVIATSGKVDPAAMALAGNRSIEVLAGEDLWRQIQRFVPHELREDVQTRSRTEAVKRLGLSAAGAAIAGLLTAAMLPAASAPEPLAATPVANSTARTEPRTLPAAAAMPTEARPSLDPTLSEEQLAARRAGVAMEVRNNPIVANAVWSTKSTLVITLRQANAEVPEALFDEVCRIVLQHEEQRFSRLQIESPAAEGEPAPTVRWKQCR